MQGHSPPLHLLFGPVLPLGSGSNKASHLDGLAQYFGVSKGFYTLLALLLSLLAASHNFHEHRHKNKTSNVEPVQLPAGYPFKNKLCSVAKEKKQQQFLSSSATETFLQKNMEPASTLHTVQVCPCECVCVFICVSFLLLL